MTDEWNTPAALNHRWVCAVCGRMTEPGGKRTDLRDTSCVTHGVLCHADKRDGIWHLVTCPVCDRTVEACRDAPDECGGWHSMHGGA